MRAASLALVSAISLAACGTDDPDDAIDLTISGGLYAKHGIPGTDFADGWDVHFDLVLVSFGAPRLEGSDTVLASLPDFWIFDLHSPRDGVAIPYASLAPTLRPSPMALGFTIRPEPTAVAGNAVDGDAGALKTSGNSLRLKGTGTKGDQLAWFDWSFASDVTFGGCGTSGATAVDATLHVENLFRDAAGTLAFELIAAADGADGSSLDGTITLAELEARSLAAEDRYQISGQALPDLRAFIAHQVTTIGHGDGDHRCTDVTVAP